LDYSVLW